MKAAALQEIDVAVPRRKWPRYPRYKPTGVAGLGEVPGHWIVKPLKAILIRNDGGCWGDEPDGASDTIVLRSTEQMVGGGWQIDAPAMRKLTEKERGSCRLREGDLLITKSSGSELHIGKTSIVSKDIESQGCCFSNFMQRLRCSNELIPHFLFYVLNSPVGRDQFVYGSNSTTGLANLTGAMIGNLRFPLPPLDEQRAIAAFLDRETARIDELIAGIAFSDLASGVMARMARLLNEFRSALITAAVTGQIDVRNHRTEVPT